MSPACRVSIFSPYLTLQAAHSHLAVDFLNLSAVVYVGSRILYNVLYINTTSASACESAPRTSSLSGPAHSHTSLHSQPAQRRVPHGRRHLLHALHPVRPGQNSWTHAACTDAASSRSAGRAFQY
jgi:hypothetical protein